MALSHLSAFQLAEQELKGLETDLQAPSLREHNDPFSSAYEAGLIAKIY